MWLSLSFHSYIFLEVFAIFPNIMQQSTIGIYICIFIRQCKWLHYLRHTYAMLFHSLHFSFIIFRMGDIFIYCLLHTSVYFSFFILESMRRSRPIVSGSGYAPHPVSLMFSRIGPSYHQS